MGFPTEHQRWEYEPDPIHGAGHGFTRRRQLWHGGSQFRIDAYGMVYQCRSVRHKSECSFGPLLRSFCRYFRAHIAGTQPQPFVRYVHGNEHRRRLVGQQRPVNHPKHGQLQSREPDTGSDTFAVWNRLAIPLFSRYGLESLLFSNCFDSETLHRHAQTAHAVQLLRKVPEVARRSPLYLVER